MCELPTVGWSKKYRVSMSHYRIGCKNSKQILAHLVLEFHNWKCFFLFFYKSSWGELPEPLTYLLTGKFKWLSHLVQDGDKSIVLLGLLVQVFLQEGGNRISRNLTQVKESVVPLAMFFSIALIYIDTSWAGIDPLFTIPCIWHWTRFSDVTAEENWDITKLRK